MSSKYYTPSSEEFHVGFEYEFKHSDFDEWIKYSTPQFNPELEDYCFSPCGEIRVKYLDREDIESLGFTDFQRSVCDWYKLEGHFPDNYASYGYWNMIRLNHCYGKNEMHQIQIQGYEYSCDKEPLTILFQGEIKNKSELKKVLEMLGIEK